MCMEGRGALSFMVAEIRFISLACTFSLSHPGCWVFRCYGWNAFVLGEGNIAVMCY